MSDELETLLREHYRRGADRIQPDGALLHRLRNAADPAHGASPGRIRRRFRPRAGLWAVPVLAAAVVIALVLLWPGGERPARPEPLSPPGPTPSQSVTPPVPKPTHSPTRSPTNRPPRSPASEMPIPAPTSEPSPPSPSRVPGPAGTPPGH
ncbi:hypothetical protein [Actinomadura sp. 9N407]|uniref:hypothetical protein n=1 Tax=Actinomadura sp. 9N407 TaxID=3375154 RepID=UPI0037A7C6D0